MIDQNRALKQLHSFQNLFNKSFRKFFSQKKKQIGKISASAKVLIESIEEYTFRESKRIRPAFIYFGYIATGGKDLDSALKLAQSAELLHTFALIHDDLIDKSSLRRGKPTIDQIFEKKTPKHIVDKSHYGLSSALLVGDLTFSYADEIFTNSSFEPKIMLSAKKYFDLLKDEVIAGQYLDVLITNDLHATKDKITNMITLKTAKYTIERPLHIGAALASAPNFIFKAFSNYAIPLGLAFQIQDDILGVFGDPKVTGKSSDSDLKEGKMTVLLANALSLASLRQKQILAKVIGNPNSKFSDIAKVKQIIINTKALDITKEEIDRLILKAKKGLINVKLENNSKDFLLGIADFIGNRLH